MLNLLGKRLLQLIPTLFFVSVLIFSLQQPIACPLIQRLIVRNFVHHAFPFVVVFA